MKTNQAGRDLIKRFEGFRGEAYRCPADVWTIGYGHTSAAGSPRVARGDHMTRDKAELVLMADLGKFEQGVEALVRVELSAPQFSALVSFAYNVGLGALAKSSVLRAVNAREFDKVPRRLMLWVKAGGRTLPGLVKRRAAEALLWGTAAVNPLMEAEMPSPTEAEIHEMDAARTLLDMPAGKSAAESSTVLTTLATAAVGIVAAGREALYQANEIAGMLNLDPDRYAWLGAAAFIACGAAWVIRERMKKSADEGI